MADTEFLQVAIPWVKKAESMGVVVRPVRSRDEGVLEIADFEKVIGPRTRVVCVSSVQWCSGYRIDSRALGELCASRGIWFVLDVIQELGALDMDFTKIKADFVVAGGDKWLNAPHGGGPLAVSQRVLASSSPARGAISRSKTPREGGASISQRPP